MTYFNDVIVRPYDAEDDPYIYSTWTKYSWYSPKRPILIGKKRYFKEKNEEIKAVLTEGIVKIACMQDDPSLIIGYIVVKDRKIAWICVKKDYHNQGVDAMLIRSMKGELECPMSQ